MEIKSDSNWWVDAWLALVSLFTGLIAYFSNMAINDRDARMDKLEEWKKEHEKNHPSMTELVRMHEENRSWLTGLSEQQERNRDSSEKSFIHLNKRIDALIDRSHNQRDSD